MTFVLSVVADSLSSRMIAISSERSSGAARVDARKNRRSRKKSSRKLGPLNKIGPTISPTTRSTPFPAFPAGSYAAELMPGRQFG